VIVEDCADLSNYVHAASCDFIFSSHLLEHIEDAAGAVAHWWSLLKTGGHLVLYLPHRDLYPNIGQPGANPDHKHDFLPGDVVAMIPAGFDLLVNETRDQDEEYSFLLVARKRADQFVTMPCHDPKPEKTACIVRHGGFGDQLQAAMLLPELKRLKYHITFLTTEKGRSVLEHDPHIDEWYMVDVDQVPNAELAAFWHVTAKKYDKFINLNESVEGTFLAMPGRINHTWPQPLRHKMMNVNYGEFAADLAGIRFIPEGFFYPTAEERAWANDYLNDIRAKVNGPIGTVTQPVYFLMYVLAGSSPHKWTPWQDNIVNAVLKFLPQSFVIFVGDAACKVLEMGWENHQRVICESGELTMRQTLALALQMNHILGPETGVMNAVAFQTDIAKTVLLSHSSEENLTKHWVNTRSIPGVAPCYPCHQLHFTAQFCPRDENKAAICQAGVEPHAIYASIAAHYQRWESEQRRAA
jgi:ADP-heptose:LPS heptosyltransferase